MNIDAQYHADTSRVSNSMLSLLKRSPRLFYEQYILGKKSEPTEAMRFGSYLHTLVLEPLKIPERYYVMPKVDRRTKEGKNAYLDAINAAATKEVISMDDAELAELCANSILTHSSFQLFVPLIDDAVIEQPILFKCWGHDCRCKPDMVHIDSGICFDIKTAKGASPRAFATSVADFGYHRQAAFYLHALEQQYEKEFRFMFVVVETTAPYESAIYELDREAIRKGFDELCTLLDEYRMRLSMNDWSSEFTKGVNTLSLPKWYQSGIYQYEGVFNDE
jgi:exodeoxyribonuclease VIII